MPNHITTIITVKTHQNEFKSLCIDEESYFDFNKIIPMPTSLDIESSSCIEHELAAHIGHLFKQCSKSFYIDRFSEDQFKNLDINKFTQYLNNIKTYGSITWYEWAPKNWGTKWNSYDNLISENDGSLVVQFDTAWSHPDEIINKIIELIPNIELDIKYADEDLGSNCGYYSVKNNEKTDIHLADYHNNTKEERTIWRNFAGQLKYGDKWEDIKKEYEEDEE